MDYSPYRYKQRKDKTTIALHSIWLFELHKSQPIRAKLKTWENETTWLDSIRLSRQPLK